MKTFLTHAGAFVAGSIISGLAVYAYTDTTEILIVNDQDKIEEVEQDTSMDEEVTVTTTSSSNMTPESGPTPSGYSVEITAEQYNCALEILGQERMNEIAGGDKPGLLELSKLIGCI